MKKYQILLFLASVLGILALVSAVFPDDGLALGRVTVSFPTLSEVFGSRTDTLESPESLIARRESAARAEKKEEYERYFTSDPARIHMPEGDIHFLDPLFEALDGAGEEAVNIVHYGDSQIEEDRISREIRLCLQERFGGGGPGLQPAGTYYSLSVSENASGEGRRFLIYGTESQRAGIRQYGPMASFVRIDSSIRYSLRIDPRDKVSAGCSGVQLLCGNRNSAVTASCGGVRKRIEAGKEMTISGWKLQDSTRRVTLDVNGSTDIYGIRLYKDKGINLDNIAMRGCSGDMFTSLDDTQLRQYFKSTGTRLIILQYGGNRVPYTSTDKSISTYKTTLCRQINHLRALAPQAKVLLIGPADMSTTIKGRRCTYPHLPQFVDSLRGAALESGAAFWDMYAAMGGEGSMSRWVESRPALAGPDHVHFTPLGARHIGKMFSSSLMMYHDYYEMDR